MVLDVSILLKGGSDCDYSVCVWGGALDVVTGLQMMTKMVISVLKNYQFVNLQSWHH